LSRAFKTLFSFIGVALLYIISLLNFFKFLLSFGLSAKSRLQNVNEKLLILHRHIHLCFHKNKSGRLSFRSQQK